MQEPQGAMTPLEDLKRDALRHYEELATKYNHWNSLIPKAIEAYNPEDLSAPASPVEEEPPQNPPIERQSEDQKCQCGHLHSQHGPTGSINYSAGRCAIKECNCLHFLIAPPAAKPSPVIEDEKSVHPIYKGWDSAKLIGRVRARHKELIEKGWDWRSFYSGWLEGRSGMLQEMLTEYDAPHPAPAEQALPEEAKEIWSLSIGGKNIPDIDFPHPFPPDIRGETEKEKIYRINCAWYWKQLKDAQALIKEKQDWINSHI